MGRKVPLAGFRDIGDLSWMAVVLYEIWPFCVGKTIVNYPPNPPNHHKIGCIDEFQMGGLWLFYPHIGVVGYLAGWF